LAFSAVLTSTKDVTHGLVFS